MSFSPPEGLLDLCSTLDYRLELANLSTPPSHSSQPMQTFTSASITPSTSSTFFSVATGYRLFSSSSKKDPDPDQENIVWNEMEQYSANISRKEDGRDSSSLIRDVLGRRAVSNSDAGVLSSRFTALSANPSVQLAEAAHATMVKPQVNEGLSYEVASGLVSEIDATDSEGRHLGSADITPTRSHPGSVKSGSTSSVTVDDNTRGEKVSSSISNGSESDRITIQQMDTEKEKISVPPSSPLPLPPKGPIQTLENTSDQKDLDAALPPLPPSPPATASGFTTSLGTGLNNAMRYVFSSETSSRFSTPPSNIKHHDLLRSDMNIIDERPHIKYDWTMGKRVKFSCTVYYAKQFDVLRKRCGVNDVFVKSLSRSTNWSAEGGKSKSNFWKTNDDRFIIKTLVNAWNVADL
jgi:1-phosphatidylinositol-3-phosphate 5-kinase